MIKSTVLLSAPDWITSRGIEQVLQAAGYGVLLAGGQAVLPADTGLPDVAVVAIDDTSPVGANSAVAICARHGLPVIWLLTGGHLERLLTVSALRTVGLLIMPVHEAQLLATVAVGLTLARSSHGASSPLGVGSAGPLEPTEPGPSGTALGQLPLTERQRIIVRMLLDGDRVSTIAEHLQVQPSTVRAHLNRVYQRLGVHSQARLVRAVKSGSWPGSVSPLG